MTDNIIDVKEEIKLNDNVDVICCSKTKFGFVKYVVQLMIASSVLCFSIIMLSMDRKDPIYYSLITLVIGVFLPTPKR
jgi:hypothetical protein